MTDHDTIWRKVDRRLGLPRMRTLAIDYGRRRVGLAMSDEGARFASPLEVLEVEHPDQALPDIRALIQREAVARLVVGLPLNMDDSLGESGREVIAFVRHLLGAEILIPVVFVDERLSSFEAEQNLITQKRLGAKISRQQKKRRLDAVAAAGILQGFLDGNLPAVAVPFPTAPPSEGS